jgi:hypothetical protein
MLVLSSPRPRHLSMTESVARSRLIPNGEPMADPSFYRDKAEQALRLARDMTDPELVKSLKDMAQEYCARADEIEKSALGEPAKDQFGEMCAANCGQLASTRTSWANKALHSTLIAPFRPSIGRSGNVGPLLDW